MHENDHSGTVTSRRAEGTSYGAMPLDASWFARNARRLELLDQELKKGLTPTEAAELSLLQEECDRRLDALAPLPFDVLGRAKECARREGLLAPPSPKQ